MRFAVAKRRLQRLERGSDGGCPACAGAPCVSLRGKQPAPICHVCGRELPACRIIHDPDFYHNRDRLLVIGAISNTE
jgi:hypothetical protein